MPLRNQGKGVCAGHDISCPYQEGFFAARGMTTRGWALDRTMGAKASPRESGVSYMGWRRCQSVDCS